MTDHEVDSIARYLAHEVDSVPAFDDDATDATTGFPTLDAARDHYRGHARAILRALTTDRDLKVLKDFLSQLPPLHHERAGVIRAIEVLKLYRQ